MTNFQEEQNEDPSEDTEQMTQPTDKMSLDVVL
jgi:hypothetical protein